MRNFAPSKITQRRQRYEFLLKYPNKIRKLYKSMRTYTNEEDAENVGTIEYRDPVTGEIITEIL